MSKKEYAPTPSTKSADQDYRRQLNKEENAYLTKFNNEYYNGAVKKWDRTVLHKGNELRKDCYARNNRIRRDIWNTLPVPLDYAETGLQATSFDEIEDALIDYIDAKNGN